MADMLSDGMTWLAGQLKASASETVTYRRGVQSCTIKATFASQVLRVADGQGGTKVERPDADFIFTAADLDFGDSLGPVEPRDGDVIEKAFGAVTKQFRAIPVNNGNEPSWRYSDPFQTIIRVHTKYVGTV